LNITPRSAANLEHSGKFVRQQRFVKYGWLQRSLPLYLKGFDSIEARFLMYLKDVDAS
jgi:hypothetical protein